MLFTTTNRKTVIYLQPTEDRTLALRAIARASYESAQAVGYGILHFKANSSLTDEECDALMDVRGYALRMDYVRGRQCKTYIKEISATEFALLDSLYERDRGKPDEMLARANDLLTGARKK